MLRVMPGIAAALLAAGCGAQGRKSSPAAGTDSLPTAARRDSAPCVPGDRMPVLRPDTGPRYALRVLPPDTTTKHAIREQRVPICPDSAPAR